MTAGTYKVALRYFCEDRSFVDPSVDQIRYPVCLVSSVSVVKVHANWWKALTAVGTRTSLQGIYPVSIFLSELACSPLVMISMVLLFLFVLVEVVLLDRRYSTCAASPLWPCSGALLCHVGNSVELRFFLRETALLASLHVQEIAAPRK